MLAIQWYLPRHNPPSDSAPSPAVLRQYPEQPAMVSDYLHPRHMLLGLDGWLTVGYLIAIVIAQMECAFLSTSKADCLYVAGILKDPQSFKYSPPPLNTHAHTHTHDIGSQRLIFHFCKYCRRQRCTAGIRYRRI